MTPQSQAEWIAFEAAAWKRARIERGLDREHVPAEFASGYAIDYSRPHAHRILETIQRIANYVPSSYTDSGAMHTEFRPNRV